MRLKCEVVDAHHCLETRIGILRALVERAASLNTLEDEVCEVSLYRTFSMQTWDDTVLGSTFCISSWLRRRPKVIRPLCSLS
jgi:hypothetical protein